MDSDVEMMSRTAELMAAIASSRWDWRGLGGGMQEGVMYFRLEEHGEFWPPP
jgi:hypothetical protein